MQVYVELAVIENFCMDFTLLYIAKVLSKNPVRTARLIPGAILGAAVAVAFPLFRLSALFQTAAKILSALLMCLVSGRFQSFKSYIKFTGIFLLSAALLGGALIGAFTLFGWEYREGEGYLFSSVPIGVPAFTALILVLGAKRLALRLSKNSKNAVICRIYAGQTSQEVKGFFDSGNKVYIKGQPVSVIPKEIAEKLVDENSIKDEVKIHTVAGSKNIKVFTADRLEILSGEKTSVILKVKLGISPRNITRAVLHCDLLEGINV